MATVLLLACGGESESAIAARSLFTSRDDVVRRQSGTTFDTLWVFGGPTDTLLASPWRLRHDGAMGVVFLDLQNQGAYRIGKGGRLLWSWGKPGEGPGELLDVRAIDVEQDGKVVMVDPGNQRVVRLSPNGLLLEEKPMPGPNLTVESVAALPGGRLAVSGHNPLLALWDDDAVEHAALPSNLGEPSPIQHTGRLVGWGTQGWVFGFYYGNGWMTFRNTDLTAVFPYAEHFDFPVLRRVRRGEDLYTHLTRTPTVTGSALSVVGDTLFVLFGGEDQLAGRLLDKFDVRYGAYLETDLLPHYANEAVVGGDRLFTLEAWNVSPRIVALARRPAPQP